MGLKTYLKNNSWNIISLTIGLIGLWIGVIPLSEKIREPIFAIDPVKAELATQQSADSPLVVFRRDCLIIVNNTDKKIAGSSEQFPDAQLFALKKDCADIKSNVTSIQFYFWNKGKLSIEDKDVLERLTITPDNPEVKFLSYKLLKVSRPVTGLKLYADPNNPHKSLLLDFRILEEGDGASGEIIYEGKPEAKFNISGTIKEVKRIGGVSDAVIIFLVRVPKLAIWLITFAIAAIVFNYIAKYVIRILTQRFSYSEDSTKKVLIILMILSSLVLATIVVIVLPSDLYWGVTGTEERIRSYVSQSILPNR